MESCDEGSQQLPPPQAVLHQTEPTREDRRDDVAAEHLDLDDGADCRGRRRRIPTSLHLDLHLAPRKGPVHDPLHRFIASGGKIQLSQNVSYRPDGSARACELLCELEPSRGKVTALALRSAFGPSVPFHTFTFTTKHSSSCALTHIDYATGGVQFCNILALTHAIERTHKGQRRCEAYVPREANTAVVGRKCKDRHGRRPRDWCRQPVTATTSVLPVLEGRGRSEMTRMSNKDDFKTVRWVDDDANAEIV
ncbi:unnamed protein product [Caenorhabditis auriculariae]|uniref:Uncharacterized protein n=1 Tax=Caenorhabditis auriculariae TaxID=2777116 RepID=A0A8S1HNY1_9PELO|nr:unnamed protein product [Caenorhabditis auriculariae]